MELEVQISTFGKAGLHRVAKMKLPEIDGVKYLVSLQNPDGDVIDVPQALERGDIKILEHADRGLSVNRNYGIENGNCNVILIADDDLDYTSEGLNFVKSVFENNPTLDFATFRHEGDDGKKFPDHEFEIKRKLPKDYYLTSFELAIRRSSLPDDLRFSPMLGIGSPLFSVGEENVFMYRMVMNGLRGRFFPYTIAVHRGQTSGVRLASITVLQGQGAWLWIRYGWIEGFLRVLVDTPRRNAPFFKSLIYMIKGFCKAHCYFDKTGEDIVLDDVDRFRLYRFPTE